MTEPVAFRVSVRELVAFNFFPPDILPGRDAARLLAGTRAHIAREAEQAAEFETEKPVSRTVERDGARVTVFGRMDAFRPGEPPLIEEIKHCRSVPGEALPEHRAQALLYGAMVSDAEGCESVVLRVAYVDEAGALLRSFEETLSRGELEAGLEAMLAPWLKLAVFERAHAERRDETLRALTFPYERYRAGQRELAAQVYTAVSRKRRLFASLPTGTGKSAAVLFPALKAMGEGLTRKLVYLTARTTARQSPLAALELMRAKGADIRVTTVLAMEKVCPVQARCHPDDCPRAKGHYLRQEEGIDALLEIGGIWTEPVIAQVADEHCLCPFELSLALVERADVVLMDVNYAFDPFAQMQRLFDRRRDFTLLVDEAHHLLDRVRESLSGALDTRALRDARASFGKRAGRKHPYYKALSRAIHALEALSLPDEDAQPREGVLQALPDGLTDDVQALMDAADEALAAPGAAMEEIVPVMRLCAGFSYAAAHCEAGGYALLLTERGRERALEIACLSPAERVAEVTKPLRGSVFFSATLSPLPAMKELLGGTEKDACFSLPSPFPPERLAVVRRRVNTRYQYRERSAEEVARALAEAVASRGGKYIAYFPSYAYMRLVMERLDGLDVPPLLIQENDMSDEAREHFLRAFTEDGEPKLGLCVLGGLFSEGVDLPGDQLIGAIIVGVGLPTPTLKLRTMQAYYQQRFGDGFLYACQIPGMQKVLQAGGRVIRTETDKGLILLLDDRYYEPRYRELLPPEWRLTNESVAEATKGLEGL